MRSTFRSTLTCTVLVGSCFSSSLPIAAPMPVEGKRLHHVPLSLVTQKSFTRLAVAQKQARVIRAQSLDETANLLLAGPAITAAEYARSQHFMHARLPGLTSNIASTRLLSAELANHAERQSARSRPVDINQLQFLNLGHTLVVAEPGAEISATPNGGVTIDPGVSTESNLAPLIPNSIGFQSGFDFRGPNVTSADFGDGSCGNSFRSPGGRGRVGICWWKYRAHDKKLQDDYWAYLAMTIAEPEDISWQTDPYIRFAWTASQMTKTHRDRLKYKKFVDHDPRKDGSRNCRKLTVSVGGNYGAGNASVGLTIDAFCDKWRQFTNGVTGYKRNKFDTGVVGENGEDVEIAHSSLSHTRQRPWKTYFPSWTDTWWASFCRITHRDCQTY